MSRRSDSCRRERAIKMVALHRAQRRALRGADRGGRGAYHGKDGTKRGAGLRQTKWPLKSSFSARAAQRTTRALNEEKANHCKSKESIQRITSGKLFFSRYSRPRSGIWR